MEKYLYLIADISGFTKFVKQTEIDHSSHIISELLELLLEQNEIGLELAEIEGDALFLYKKEPGNDIDALMKQIEKMFLAFHQHLKVYERDRICHCGACSTANSLGLKFIIHLGEGLLREIGGKKQLMGIDVTVVHRLTKNPIDHKEYVLLSGTENSSLGKIPTECFSEKKQEGAASYDELDEIQYCFFPLEKLVGQIPEPPARRSNIEKVENPIKVEIEIDRPMMDVHQKLIDLNLRGDWKAKSAGEYELPERIGTQHYCVIPQGRALVEVVEADFENDKILYVEKFEKTGLLAPESTEIFVLEPIDSKSCRLVYEAHPKVNGALGFILKNLLGSVSKRSLLKFKKLSEDLIPA